jgi:nitrite reductase/ring-hydroxylating ferredoxin subunit
MLNYSKLIIIFVISLISVSFIGCDKYDDGIPNVRVDIRLDINTDLAKLGHSQAVTWPGGVNGIIIFRAHDREFKAYERTCPYQPSDNCKVEPDDTGLFATCPCCGSEFNLVFDGVLHKGPSKWPLKQYRTSVLNSMLHIYN